MCACFFFNYRDKLKHFFLYSGCIYVWTALYTLLIDNDNSDTDEAIISTRKCNLKHCKGDTIYNSFRRIKLQYPFLSSFYISNYFLINKYHLCCNTLNKPSQCRNFLFCLCFITCDISKPRTIGLFRF